MKYSILLLTTVFLTACNSVNIPLRYLQTDQGYYNSGNFDLGYVFVWDTANQRLVKIDQITPDQVPTSRVDDGRLIKEQSASVSGNTDFSVTASPVVSSTIKGVAAVSAINSTNVKLTNFTPREFRNPLLTLNSPALREWRMNLKEDYAGSQYRFVFIYGVSSGDKIVISHNKSGTDNLEANIVKVGEYKFKVTYDNKSEVSIDASNAPLTLKPQVFTFTIKKNQERPEYRFWLDTTSNFSFQKVKIN